MTRRALHFVPLLGISGLVAACGSVDDHAPGPPSADGGVLPAEAGPLADAGPHDASRVTPDAGPVYQTDPANCGALGHDCLGATCHLGVCVPAPVSATTTGTFVGFSAIAVDATSVYWFDNAGIMKAPKAGGVAARIASATPTSKLVVQAGALVWLGDGNVVLEAPTSGGDAGATVLFGGQDNLVTTDFSVEPGAVYGVDGCQAVYRFPLTPGAADAGAADAGDAGPETIIHQAGPCPSPADTGIATDGTYAYVLGAGLLAIARYRLDDGTMTSIPLSASPAQETLVGGTLYWATFDDCNTATSPVCQRVIVGAVSTADLSTRTVATFSAPSAPDGLVARRFLAADATSVYVLLDEKLGKADTIVRVPLDGSPPFVVYRGTTAMYAMALDDRYLYVVEATAVLRSAK